MDHGGFAHGGVVWSPRGVDNEGFALKVMFGGGSYRYISGALGNTEVSGGLLAASILPGWRFIRGKFIASIYGGSTSSATGFLPTIRRRGCAAAMPGCAPMWNSGTSRHRPR